jgi:hypothetical protein
MSFRLRRGLQIRSGAGRLAVAREEMPSLLSSRRKSPVGFDRTRNNGTHYAVDVTGGGRSSAINRRMSAKRFLGMATSAIWNPT